MQSNAIASLIIMGVSSVQFGVQVAFIWHAVPISVLSRAGTPSADSPRSRLASTFSDIANNCVNSTMQRESRCTRKEDCDKAHLVCGLLISDVLLGIIILTNTLANGLQVAISVVTIEDGWGLVEMVESVMFAIMSAAFLLCSHDRAKRVLLMVCSDKLALTLTRCVFFTTFALLVTPLIIACKLWSNHPLFERLTVYASFFSFLVASVIDLIFLFAFVKLLIEMDNESPPEAKSEASRFKIVATYGAVATSIYCCALGLSAYREIVASTVTFLATSICFNMIHVALIGMKIHSHSLKRHGRLQKEVNLQRVLKNELEVIRARSPIVTIERDRVHIEREGISRDTSVKTVASSTSMALDMLAKLEEGVATKQ